MLSPFQSPCVRGSKLNAPESNGFIADDIGWEPGTFVGIRHRFIGYGRLSCQYRHVANPSATERW